MAARTTTSGDSNNSNSSAKKRLINGYLLIYNLIQSLGWTAVLASALRAVLLPSTNELNWQERLTTVYDHSSIFVKLFQVLALLETLHAMVGFVRSPVLPSVLQWMGRTHVLMCITDSIVPLQKTTAAGVLILCWAIIDCVRYPCYALGILNATPKWLLYLRYTLFIPLYPLGAASEMKLMYDSIGFVKRVEMYYVHMPNVLNFAFDYSWFLYLVLMGYPFMFAQLYFYMFHQRRRKLKTKKA
jgi:very-long-chain (3R)-3-hydroxyacyl-CoA dehydratase